MVIEIPLSKGYVALIDDEDAHRTQRHNWHARAAKNGVYAQGKVNGRGVRLHRFILEAPHGMLVDHINRDTLDCRRSNLRICTKSQNNANSIRRNKLGFKGITQQLHRRKVRYMSVITCNGTHSCGPWRDAPETAARDYDEMARRLHGEFARLNFPLEGERAA
jgi:hypothetical protein